jgi:hypothetical protein
VTAADVQRVLKTYFVDKNRTVTTLVPEAPPEEERKTEGAPSAPSTPSATPTPSATTTPSSTAGGQR